MSFVPIGETIKRGSWPGTTRGIFLSLRVEKVLDELLPKFLPSVAIKVKIRSFRQGKLTLLTSSPAVSQEIFLNSAVITKELNKLLGGKIVEEIKLKITLEA